MTLDGDMSLTTPRGSSGISLRVLFLSLQKGQVRLLTHDPPERGRREREKRQCVECSSWRDGSVIGEAAIATDSFLNFQLSFSTDTTDFLKCFYFSFLVGPFIFTGIISSHMVTLGVFTYLLA